MISPKPGNASPAEENRFRLTLWVYLILIFAGLFIITSGAVIWHTYESSSKATLDLSSEIIKRANDAVVEKTIDYFTPLIVSAKLIAAQVARSTPDSDRGALVQHMLDVLKAYPEFYSLYVGYEDGSLVQTINRPGGLERLPSMEGLIPPATKRIVRILERHGEEISEIWTHLDDSGHILASANSKNITFDPRKRIWYREAKESREAYWADLYVFYSLSRPGITASFPIIGEDGHLLGVAGADMTLGALSSFVKSQKVGRSGVVFIMNERGELVAFPDLSRVVKIVGDKIQPAVAKELAEAWLRTAVREYGRTHRPQFMYEVGEAQYIASFTVVPTSSRQRWTIGIVVPADDFLATVKDANRTTLLISLAVLVAGIVAIGFASRALSRPIQSLVDETRKIRNFDLDGAIAIRTRIAEAHELTSSLATMKTAIRSFSKFVPRELVRQLIESGQGVEVGGHKRDLTVMFSDIEGFTGISEDMDPESLMLHVSVYFEALAAVIRSNKGTIDKFIGDSVMAFWGAPNPDDDHARNATDAVLKASRQLEQLNREWAADGKPSFHTRFGLHCGEMIVGNVGAADRLNYTVLGDAVNVASRLEGLNKAYGTRICVSQNLHDRVCESHLLRPLDVVAVKGRRQGMVIYQLLASRLDDPDIGASDAQLELCALTAAGFEAYVGRRWDESIEIFEKIASRFPGDELAEIYLARNRQYRINPPDDSWPGIPGTIRGDDPMQR